MAAWLSQNTMASPVSTWNSLRRATSQVNSLQTTESALYSASAEDLLIVGCIFVVEDNKGSPRKTINSYVDLLESKHRPQSASANAFRLKGDVTEKNKHWPSADLIYRRS